MDIRQEPFKDNCTRLTLNGRLVISSLEQFKEEVEQQIQSSKHLLFDFSGVDMIDSTSIGFLFSLYKRGMRDSIWIGFLNISESVRSIFEITGLDNLFTIVYSLTVAEEALIAFDEG